MIACHCSLVRLLSICLSSQECLDCTFSWFRGLAAFPLLPSAQEEEDEEDEGLDESMRETAKEKEERKSDHDVAREDVVKVKEQNLLILVRIFSFTFSDLRSNDCCFSGSAENETSPQVTLHP